MLIEAASDRGSNTWQRIWPRFLCIFTPFLVVFIVEYYIVGRTPFDIYSSNALQYLFVPGAFWSTDHWPALFYNARGFALHVPAVTLSQLSSVAFAVLGPPLASFASFAWFMAYGSLALVGRVSAWGAWVIRHSALSLAVIFGAASLAAAGPATAHFWTSSPMTTAGMLCVGLALADHASRRDSPGSIPAGVWFVLGYLTTAHLVTGVLMVGLLFAGCLLLASAAGRVWLASLSVGPPSPAFLFGAVVVLAVFLNGFAFSAFDIVGAAAQLARRHLGGGLRANLPAAFAVAALSVAALAFAAWRLSRCRVENPISAFVVHVGGIMLFGWLAGINILAFNVWQSIFLDILRMNAKPAPLTELIRQMFGAPWSLSIAFVVAVGGWMLFSGRRDATPKRVFYGLFSIAVVLVCFLTIPRDSYPVFGRYFVPLSALFPISLAVAVEDWRRLRPVFAVAAVLVAAIA